MHQQPAAENNVKMRREEAPIFYGKKPPQYTVCISTTYNVQDGGFCRLYTYRRPIGKRAGASAACIRTASGEQITSGLEE